MKAGTWIRLPDGREGTVVYHGLDGYGIKWGLHEVDAAEIERHVCLPEIGVVSDAPDDDWPWWTDAMLRDPYPSATLECVGEEYKVIAREETP